MTTEIKKRAERKVTIYRDDSTVQVVYEHVKSVFWTADNSMLTISKYYDVEPNPDPSAHFYIHWPRERVCWFKDEPQ